MQSTVTIPNLLAARDADLIALCKGSVSNCGCHTDCLWLRSKPSARWFRSDALPKMTTLPDQGEGPLSAQSAFVHQLRSEGTGERPDPTLVGVDNAGHTSNISAGNFSASSNTPACIPIIRAVWMRFV